MASLGEIAEMLKVNSPILPESTINKGQSEARKSVGEKRRAWLDNDENTQNAVKNNGVDKPLTKKGLINPLHKPVISTPFIDQVDHPLIDKGSIEGVYKPLSLTVENLRGNPLSIFMFVFELVKEGTDKKTRQMTITDIVKSVQISKDSARTATRFLLKNGFIKRADFKIGKHGWSQYSMPDALFNEVVLALDKGSITPFKLKPILSNDKGSISSSSLNNITTTTDDKNSRSKFSQDWENIDISPLNKIGFTKAHLSQIMRDGKLSPEMVQDSIHMFAFDLYENKREQNIKTPLNLIMSVLRKGDLYNPPQNYESPGDKVLREYHARKKEEERIRKLREQEIADMEFVEWQETVPENEKNKIAAPLPSGSTGFIACLKDFFLKNVWPSKKQEIYGISQTNTEVEMT